MKTAFEDLPSGELPTPKRTKSGDDDADATKIASLVKCDVMLDALGVKYTGTAFFQAVLPHSEMVISYAKECLRKIQVECPGKPHSAVKVSCPGEECSWRDNLTRPRWELPR